MRKSVAAITAAVSVAALGAFGPATVSAQKMTYAELFQPWPSGAGPVGPEPSLGSVINTQGQEFIESITEVQIGDSPYPGISVDLIPQDPNYPRQQFLISATGGKIYPEVFGIPFTVRINYKDGSFEYYTDEFNVYPLESLVADNPVEPVVTSPPPWETVVVETTTVTAPPVTTTVTAAPETTTVTAEPVETTVTAPPVTTTVTAAPETTTVTAPPVTTTVTAAPETTTVTAEPVETTVTAPPVTTTVTAAPETTTVTAEPVETTVTVTAPANNSTSSEGVPGGVIGVLVGILSVLGLGAGAMFAAFHSGLI